MRAGLAVAKTVLPRGTTATLRATFSHASAGEGKTQHWTFIPIGVSSQPLRPGRGPAHDGEPGWGWRAGLRVGGNVPRTPGGRRNGPGGTISDPRAQYEQLGSPHGQGRSAIRLATKSC